MEVFPWWEVGGIVTGHGENSFFFTKFSFFCFFGGGLQFLISMVNIFSPM